jgi:hypothetical protein
MDEEGFCKVSLFLYDYSKNGKEDRIKKVSEKVSKGINRS